ncbi:hypothetical protein OJ996_13805 [Luteolibacter sp. GHJ8]|uniref:Uncharacterized protein n=1 Tax=Luteolibacter rhizosphaerae TaxID=2989719 RepID=A0ABT3G4S2_9BACT|nr:hypothetical protein [Luteolibacter rhizosphaerae]MCW1914657.1 hypothetical protein [Luteolibacter rhizosphaerae]
MFECWWQQDGFEAWHLRGDLRGASRRWQHRLHDELWLWINTSGEGVVWGKDHRIFLKDGLFGCFGGQEGEPWKWTRLPGHHEAEILIIPRDYLAANFSAAAAAKNTPFAKWLRGEQGMSFAGLSAREEKRLATLLGRGWNSKRMPAAVKRALDRWVERILGMDQALTPRASACGRKRTRSQVRKTKPISHQIQ